MNLGGMLTVENEKIFSEKIAPLIGIEDHDQVFWVWSTIGIQSPNFFVVAFYIVVSKRPYEIECWHAFKSVEGEWVAVKDGGVSSIVWERGEDEVN